MKKGKLLSLLMALSMVTSMIIGCSPAASPSESEKPAEPEQTKQEEPKNEQPEQTEKAEQAPAKEEVTFIIPVWNPVEETIFNELGLAEKVKAAIPNLTVKIEVLKETEYESTMKIRNQSGELPDVFPLQQKWLLTFADGLMPLDGMTATANNLYAAENTVNGQVLGLPYTRFGEVVYYHKSIFEEYGLKAPQTWDEFIAACQKIKDGGKYIPLIMGAKDSWTDYPFNEFMPSIVAKNGDYYSTMATMDAPFADDQPFAQSYKMIQQFYDGKFMGDDPLGIGFDQSKAMFAAKQGAMIAAGEWLINDLNPMFNEDLSGISTFILPVRTNASDELVTAGSVEQFWCINKNTKHPEEAKALIDFLFNKDQWYTAHINRHNLGPTVKDVTLSNPPEVFKEAYNTPNLKYIIYKAGDEKFNSIRDAIKFDVKDLGVQMILESKLPEKLKKLNEDWAAARKQLGIN